MRYIVVIILFVHYVGTTLSIERLIPVIHNSTLRVLNSTSSFMNGICDECICTMMLSTMSISALNCFRNNNTCELFSVAFDINSMVLTSDTTTSIYFISLPGNNMAITTDTSTCEIFLKVELFFSYSRKLSSFHSTH